MKKVLLLNANGEPLSLIHWTKALTLVFKKKVDVYEYFEGESVSSATQEFQVPSVIALVRYVMIPNRRNVGLNKKNVLVRDGHECQYCGKHTLELTLDHIQPRHLGGEHIWTNVVAACPTCNHRKGGRKIEEAHMNLLRPPREPPASAMYIFGRHLVENNEWEQFIQGW